MSQWNMEVKYTFAQVYTALITTHFPKHIMRIQKKAKM